MNNKIPFNPPLVKDGKKPKLLLHSCCAPCSTSVLEMLSDYFEITVLYYNPNIYPQAEFEKRCQEQRIFCEKFSQDFSPVSFVASDYRCEDFEKATKGMENLKEGGERCRECFRLRLSQTARYAKENGFEYFTTTLSVSPMKNSEVLNEIGEEIAKEYGIKYLKSDFKKRDGYKRSCELSKKYNMYRQDFCGCKFSLAEKIMSAKGFIFDADGTLFDTMAFYRHFTPRYVASQGIEPRADLRESIRSFTIKECAHYLCDTYDMGKSAEDVLNDFDALLKELYTKKAVLKDGVKEFLEYSHSKGIKMCIATATDSQYIEMALRETGTLKYFEFIITCTDVGASKRVSDIYDKATEKLSLTKKDVVVFEDALYAVKTAKTAEYRVVGVEDADQILKKDAVIELSDIYVKSMTDLIKRENLK